jgi:hypothetical protein
VETAVPRSRPADEILDEIKIRRPELLVMATHGCSGVGRWVYSCIRMTIKDPQFCLVLVATRNCGTTDYRAMAPDSVRPRNCCGPIVSAISCQAFGLSSSGPWPSGLSA